MQQNRYLWVHFAGLALVPLLLDACLAGLASAGPALPYGGQFWAIALISIPPSLAMQWLKPFYIFSLPPLALKPDALSEDQRRCLGIFQSWQIKAIAGLTAGFAFWLLVQLYLRSSTITPVFTPVGGWAVAAIAFFLTCTLLQISIVSGRALLVSQSTLQRVAAVDVGEVPNKFLILGFGLRKLLPEGSLPKKAQVTSTTPPKRNLAKTEEQEDSASKEPNLEEANLEEANLEEPNPEEANLEEAEPEELKPEASNLEETTTKETVAETGIPPSSDNTDADSSEEELSTSTSVQPVEATDDSEKNQPMDEAVQSP